MQQNVDVFIQVLAAAAFAEQRPTENTVSVDTALTINWQLHVVGSLKCPEG